MRKCIQFSYAKTAASTRKNVDIEKTQENRILRKRSVFVSDTSQIQTCLLLHFSEELHCNICFGTMEDISIITLHLGPIASCITTLL